MISWLIGFLVTAIGFIAAVLAILDFWQKPLTQQFLQKKFGRKQKILITYSPPDSHIALILQKVFRKAEYDVFLEGEEIKPNSKKMAKIFKEIRSCDYLVIILSNSSLISETLALELNCAKSRKNDSSKQLGILPLFLDLDVAITVQNYSEYYKNLRGISAWQLQGKVGETSLNFFGQEIVNHIKQNQRFLPGDREWSIDWTSLPVSLPVTPVNLSPSTEKPLVNNSTELEFPEGLVPLSSLFYIKRLPIETQCYEAIERPYALIRIKAPQQMGKTSLMVRILEKAKNAGYRAVYIDLMAVNQGILQNPDKFLPWFCSKVGKELELQPRLEEYWDEAILGSNDNCTAYFEEYLLKKVPTLALGLDAVDRLFPHQEIAQDFFGLLRTWHEYGKSNEIWKNFRVVVAHSTEVDVTDITPDIHKSPFNVGLSIELSELTESQVQDLADLHQLRWTNNTVKRLMKMVGGHPYLIRLALYYIYQKKFTLEEILEKAPTDEGIYQKHLQRHLFVFENERNLAIVFKSILENKHSQAIPKRQQYKLKSMGLIKTENKAIIPRCNLYYQYFKNL
ncbi:MAG: AAA-like domain-containing protein [Cyanobacteria bacterium SBLK]|nr:AAA-like domain-containing protein [Cyanobacteria bacterium SBLK]